MHSRIYLDNAATSWPKPESVYAAVNNFLRESGAAAGRGGHRHGRDADQIVRDARDAVARLIGARDPRHVIFCFNGTDALNQAIHGIVRPGDHIVTTVCEHNSVLRPLADLAAQANVVVSYVDCDEQGLVTPSDVAAAMRSDTRLVVVVHGSNVTGAIQPIAEIGAIASEFGAYFLVDAAQTLGHVPLDVDELGIDLLAAPGHKGLLGPLGTGILYVRPGVERELQPLRQGGTGSRSHLDLQPGELPDKYESGNLNVPGIAGLAAGCKFLLERGVARLAEMRQPLTARLIEGLADVPGVRVYGPDESRERLDVVSISVEGYDPQEVAAMLDASCGIECRAGLHCAPRMHRALGTDRLGGTIRFSLGWATSEEEIIAVLSALEQLQGATVDQHPY
jgi:cysteine desulfurase family protein